MKLRGYWFWVAGGLVSAGFSGCGNTSSKPGNASTTASGGSSATGAGGTTGTTGTSQDGTTTTAGSTTGSSTTGVAMTPLHCHSLEAVLEAEAALMGSAGMGGEAGASGVDECPQYYPHVLGPPCGGELFPSVSQPDLECCYTRVICN